MEPLEANASGVDEGAVAFTLTVHNVDATAVLSDDTIRDRFEMVIRQAVASRSGIGIAPQDVRLMAGPLIVQCVVTFPSAISASDVQLRLDSSAALSHNVAAAMSVLDGIDAFCFGPVSVCHIGEAMAAVLVGFQGNWKKDLGTFLIRGTVLNFPSCANTEIVAISSTTFSIKNSLGVELQAHLVANGQQLQWSNGSVWHRAAPHHTSNTLHALQNALRESVVERMSVELTNQERILAKREELMNSRNTLMSARSSPAKHPFEILQERSREVIDVAGEFDQERRGAGCGSCGCGRSWLPCCGRCNPCADRSGEVEVRTPLPRGEREEELVREAEAKWPAICLQLGNERDGGGMSYKAMSAYSHSGNMRSTLRVGKRGGA